jgi:diguanylate cyclase (GGDEF)-like protein
LKNVNADRVFCVHERAANRTSKAAMGTSTSFLASKSSRLAASGMFAQEWGIPDDEYTPRVRDAIATLTVELDVLRNQLRQTRHALEEIEKAADLDPLLPILNRRAFMRTLSRHIAAIGRYAAPASLIYFDLDGFKSVNDTLGHSAGDAALRHFTNMLLLNTRESDAVGRLGGDEFGVLLCHATLELAHAKADAVARKLHAAPAAWNGMSIGLAFSCGVFELTSGESAESAMERADAEMYVRKRQAGRARQAVVTAPAKI